MCKKISNIVKTFRHKVDEGNIFACLVLGLGTFALTAMLSVLILVMLMKI